MKRPKYILQFMFMGKMNHACDDMKDVKEYILAYRPKKYRLFEIQKMKRVTVDRRQKWAR